MLSNGQTEDTQKLWMNKSVMLNTLRKLLMLCEKVEPCSMIFE